MFARCDALGCGRGNGRKSVHGDQRSADSGDGGAVLGSHSGERERYFLSDLFLYILYIGVYMPVAELQVGS